MARDWLAEFGPRVAPVLPVGESLREVVPASLTLGADQVEDAENAASWEAARADARETVARVAPARERKTLASRLFGKLGDGALDFVSGTSPVPGTAPDMPNPNGTGLVGAPGSMAVRLRDLLAGEDVTRLLAATDRSVLVLDDPLGRFGAARAQRAGTAVPPLTVLSAVPAQALRGVVKRPIQLTRGRVEITFSDGSMLAVDTGTGPLADRFAAAAPVTWQG